MVSRSESSGDWSEVRARVERAWAETQFRAEPATREAVRAILGALDRGELRVAEPVDGEWRVHAWIKQAILLYFAQEEATPIDIGPFHFRDKVPLKSDPAASGLRIVPPAAVRFGAYLEPGVVVMPAFVNVGAWVGAGTMVDTWATVGSCAQVGRGVHISGGVGIGGVLEPPQATPVIIEDHAFLGSRAIIVEGVRVEEGAVLGAGVVLTASTPIVDVRGAQPVVTKGRVPARSVVVPGTMPKRFPAGEFHAPCALLIGERSASTDRKTSLNDVLREFPLIA